jgi:hypothetical protein
MLLPDHLGAVWSTVTWADRVGAGSGLVVVLSDDLGTAGSTMTWADRVGADPVRGGGVA